VVPGILSQLDIGEKFSKFPLENDEISPHFDDDFSDLPPFHRLQMRALYKDNLQKQLLTYTPHLQKLIDNSKLRIEKNKNYQNFLQELAKKNYDAESIQLFDQSDIQLVETLNILKDLIFLMQAKSPTCNKTP
ncbi:MAG: carboxy terminal-processing peptidase, partial [Chlamydiae bacterium]|nr:carboxy terminal-processing peptidase [Chlamydiota bacterium]